MITTIPHMLENTLEQFSDKVAVSDQTRSLTFSEMAHESLATSDILRDLGIAKGDRVGICMSKTVDQVIAMLGVLYANAVVVPVLPRLKQSNVSHIVDDCGMKMLITDSVRVREVESYSNRTTIIIGHGDVDTAFPSLPYMRGQIKECRSFFTSISMDNAAIIYSSGSTGRPKGIVISHRNLSDGARIVSTYLNTKSSDRIAGVLSLNFDYGLNQLWQTIYKGACLYLHDLIFPNDFFSFLSTMQITALPLMPVFITNMFDKRLYVPNDALDFSSLRYICSSGGAVTQGMLDNLQSTFPGVNICLMYGLTEAFRSTYLPPGQLEYRPGSIGKAIPDVEIFVLDEQGNVCPPGVPGELVHRGGCVSKGYWNDVEKTAQAFRQIDKFPGETVVFSGDLVRTDEDGYLYFGARKDDMIKTRGYRVSPSEVEQEASQHAKISSSVAFGVTNPDVGEDIALVYTTEDDEPLSDKILLQYLKDVLPSYMVPTHLVHAQEFPTTGNEGKIDRAQVISDARRRLRSDSEN